MLLQGKDIGDKAEMIRNKSKNGKHFRIRTRHVGDKRCNNSDNGCLVSL